MLAELAFLRIWLVVHNTYGPHTSGGVAGGMTSNFSHTLRARLL